MTVLATYATARAWFAPVYSVANALNNGSGLIRLVIPGHPYATGDTANVEGARGTVEANGLWTVTRVSSAAIDLQGSAFVHAYTGGGDTQKMAADGLPAWPGPLLADGSFDNARTLSGSRLRANGFSGTWQLITQGAHVYNEAACGLIGPLIASPLPGGDRLFPFQVTVNNAIADSSGDEYAWWLSQRGDPVRYPSTAFPTTVQPGGAPQLLTCVSDFTDPTFSGTVVIDVVPGEVLKLFPNSGGVAPTDAASLALIFKNTTIYCMRRSDGAFQAARFVAPSQ